MHGVSCGGECGEKDVDISREVCVRGGSSCITAKISSDWMTATAQHLRPYSTECEAATKTL